MNIIKDLYYGKITPVEKSFDPKSEYAALMNIFVENEEKITAYLESQPNAGELQGIYNKLMDAYSEAQSIAELNHFIEGFQLGARLMLDAVISPRLEVISDI